MVGSGNGNGGTWERERRDWLNGSCGIWERKWRDLETGMAGSGNWNWIDSTELEEKDIVEKCQIIKRSAYFRLRTNRHYFPRGLERTSRKDTKVIEIGKRD